MQGRQQIETQDANLLKWRQETAETGFEKTPAGSMQIKDQCFAFCNWMAGVTKTTLTFEQHLVGKHPNKGT